VIPCPVCTGSRQVPGGACGACHVTGWVTPDRAAQITAQRAAATRAAADQEAALAARAARVHADAIAETAVRQQEAASRLAAAETAAIQRRAQEQSLAAAAMLTGPPAAAAGGDPHPPSNENATDGAAVNAWYGNFQYLQYGTLIGSGQQVTAIAPSGDTTGAADLAAINAGLANGGAVQLTAAPLSAPYWINGPITPTSQSRLWGAQWWSAVNQDDYSAGIGASGGTVIEASSAFTGNAMISMVNTTGTQYYGVDLAGFCLESFQTGGKGNYGILIDGAWGAGFIRGVCVHRPDSYCLAMQADGISGYIPDDWQVTACKFSASRTAAGVYAPNAPDMWFDQCESSENATDGWYLAYCTNTRLTSCKGENNGSGAGFHLGGNGAGETLELQGCTTNLNGGDGFLFDNAGSGGLATYTLTGCRSSNDNQGGGAGIAGFRSSGCKARIIGTGCVAIGASQVYGASEVASSYGVAFTGSWLTGTSAATHDDGSNTHALSNLVPVPF